MFKHPAFTAILAILVVLAAAAATAAPLPGKVVSTATDTVVVVAHFDKVEWLKVGAPVRLMDADKGALIGKSMVIGVADSTVTLVAPKGKAKTLNPGGAVTMDKPKAGMSGC